jgi:hypothetical protein
VFGYAQSADGIEWEKHPAAVLDRGPQGSWDGGGIDQPCVIFDDRANAFLLWYRGVDVIPPQTGIGFAISPAARRSVTLPVPGCPPEPVRVALRRQIRIGSPDQMLAIREVALGPFGASQVRAGAGGVARDLPEPPLPMAGALGEFQDGRAVGLAPYCGQGNGAVRYQDGTYTLENLGEGIGPGGDSFTLAYSRVKGDFRLTAHFKDTGPRPGMAGLMVRQDLTRRSRYSFVFDRFGDVEPLSGDPLDAFRWTRRPTQGGKDDELYLVLAPGEHYDFLAIERQGDRIRAFLSDGSTFEGLGEDPWPGIPDALLVGLAFGSLAEACCQGPKSIAFDRVKLELGPGAELLPPVLPPIGVEISWDVPRRELEEEGLSYEIALPAGELRFQSGEGGIAVAGDSRALVAPRACGLFKRADTDASGSIDISDPVALIGVLFLGESAPPCFDAADTDDSGDLDLSDVIYSLSWQFLGGPEPPAPGPRACGPDPNPAAAPCEYPPASCG